MCGIIRRRNFNLLFHPVLVDAHDDLLARVDDGLTFGRALLDLQLRPAGCDSRSHATHGLNLNGKFWITPLFKFLKGRNKFWDRQTLLGRVDRVEQRSWFYLINNSFCLVINLLSQRFHHVWTSPGVDDFWNSGFLLKIIQHEKILINFLTITLHYICMG